MICQPLYSCLPTSIAQGDTEAIHGCYYLSATLQALDVLLHRLGVKWVILPAMKAVLHMWTRKFGYEQFRWAGCLMPWPCVRFQL